VKLVVLRDGFDKLVPTKSPNVYHKRGPKSSLREDFSEPPRNSRN